MALPDQELIALLADLESDRVERKESAATSDQLNMAICGFANDMPGYGEPGVLFVGVSDFRLDGDGLDAPIKDEKRLNGTLLDVLRQLDELLELNISTAVDFTSGRQEERAADYPLVALQQVTRNAVMHRSYEHTASPVRITWYSDHVEVTSPGGPYGIVSAGNFGRPGITDYRNPALADLLRGLGYVQRFGMGLLKTHRSPEVNGNPPPEFTVAESYVSVTIRRRP